MTSPAALESLYEAADRGTELPLPLRLRSLCGPLRFPPHPGRPYVIGNFVTTLDGVVSLSVPGHAGGGDISGFNPQDQMVMGVLRAAADAVIVGAGVLRATPGHLWTAEYICPALTGFYRELRATLEKPAFPLNVVVTASGDVDLGLRVFRSGEVPALIVTSAAGAQRIGEQELPASVQIATVEGAGPIGGRAILEAVRRFRQSELILSEGGPQLMGTLLAEQCIDELFYTLAPQIAGRDRSAERPGLVAGRRFAPEHPLWGRLASVKRGGDHLFLRYVFETRA